MQPSRLFNRKPDLVFRAHRPACAGAVEISGGTAGGTWINVDAAGLPSIEYVRFTVPAGDTAYINAAALSDPAVATPEPTAWALLLIPILILPVRKGWKKIA